MTPEQIELFAVESPCVGVCQVNNKGYCLGCFRSRNERLYWHTLSDEQRALILKTLQGRKAAILRKQAALQEAALALAEENTPEQGSLF